MPECVERRDGVHAARSQSEPRDVSLHESGLGNGKLREAQLAERAVNSDDPMLLTEHPRRRLTRPATEIDDEAARLHSPSSRCTQRSRTGLSCNQSR